METKTAKVLLTVFAVLAAIGILLTIGYVIKDKAGKQLPVFTLGSQEDNSKNTNASKIVFSFNASTSNTDKSLTVKNLEATEIGTNSIYWTWTNPSNENFSRCMIYLDGRNYKNTTNEYYNATDLNPGTNHTIKIYVVDIHGVKQSTYAEDTETTLFGTDTSGPSPVDNVKVTARDATSIEWSWTNPAESDFDKVLVFINDTNVKNVTDNHYKATGLAQNAYYTISLQTMDKNGNINTHSVTDTNRTGIRVCSWTHCNTYLA